MNLPTRRQTGTGMRRAVGWLALLTAGVRAAAAVVPAAEAIHAPTRQRLTALHATAQRDGWAPQVAVLRETALRAYEAERPAAAEAWYDLYRWAALLAETEAEFVPRWVEAVNRAQVGHANMTVPPARERPLGAALSPALQSWLLAHPAFLAEFFALLDPVDCVPRVFEILDELHRRDPARFQSHASLALAIAVVHDVPPPPVWPHGQVSAQALPRRLLPPADAFMWWIRQEQLGRTYHRLGRLRAAELKFVVDATAPFPELEWSQQAVHVPLADLGRAYAMVPYRTERVATNTLTWPGRTYTLREIMGLGGICADQAYFATQAGKARGVPTLFFHGAGSDGRHAWFGYLDGSRRWQLDVGRYAAQRFVTGHARDPQTWREFSDHGLRFLTEAFRELPAFRHSRGHARFAAEYLALGRPRLAAAAARKAVSYEPRNQAGWEALLAAAAAEGRDSRAIESLLREAALAFQRYPDLEAHYAARVAEHLRARGDSSAAEAELRRIALKHRSARGDLNVQQARERMRRAIEELPLLEQIRTYRSVLEQTGRGAGIAFFDAVVVPFVEHLAHAQQPAEARRALERARQVLEIAPGTQLHAEAAALSARIGAK